MSINLEKVEKTRYVKVQDIFQNPSDDALSGSETKDFDVVIQKVDLVEREKGSSFKITITIQNDDVILIYNKLGFANNKLGWSTHKDFLIKTELIEKVDAENYDVAQLEGKTFTVEFGLKINARFDHTNSKSSKYLLEVVDIKPTKTKK